MRSCSFASSTHTTIAIHVFIAIHGAGPSGRRGMVQTQLFSPTTCTSQTEAVNNFDNKFECLDLVEIAIHGLSPTGCAARMCLACTKYCPHAESPASMRRVPPACRKCSQYAQSPASIQKVQPSGSKPAIMYRIQARSLTNDFVILDIVLPYSSPKLKLTDIMVPM
jgi:hypothetical protein